GQYVHRLANEPISHTREEADGQAARTLAHLYIRWSAHPKADDAAPMQLVADNGYGRVGIVDKQLHAGVRKHTDMAGIGIVLAVHRAYQLDVRPQLRYDGIALQVHTTQR